MFILPVDAVMSSARNEKRAGCLQAVKNRHADFRMKTVFCSEHMFIMSRFTVNFVFTDESLTHGIC